LIATSKYHNIKTEIDGIKFDSRKEANRYAELKIMQQGKLIRDLELQPRFELMPAFSKNGKKFRPIVYVADFSYYDILQNKKIVEDVKSKATKTDVYKLKKKMFERLYPELTIEEV
jgi:hypothetical protein